MPVVPTIPTRITLTDEANKILATLRKTGSFRSNSETIEECVRRVFLLLQNSSPDAVEIQLSRFRRTFVTDETCFSERCWWISALIRCRNCPYIDHKGNVLDERVGKGE